VRRLRFLLHCDLLFLLWYNRLNPMRLTIRQIEIHLVRALARRIRLRHGLPTIRLHKPRAPSCQHGFTLVELVMVMIIVGILAVFAAPRFFDADIFKSRGFADQVQASLRYAQKIAIAQRRNVCVAMTAGGITLTIASASGAASACDTNLISPTGESPYKISTPSAAITLSPVQTFIFNALGKPFDTLGNPSVAQKTITISGATNPIIVEAETGYVHQ